MAAQAESAKMVVRYALAGGSRGADLSVNGSNDRITCTSYRILERLGER